VTTPAQDRATEALYRHVSADLATIKAGLPSDRALRDPSGTAREVEDRLMRAVEHGGSLTKQGLDIATHRALSAALHDPNDPDWLAKALYERDRLRAYARGEVWSVWDDLIDDAEEILDRYRDIAYDVGDIILEDGW
jgi:hypothetical protein